MANQQLALEIVAKDLATATLQKVDAALLDVARRQGSVTAATNSATTSTGQFSAGLNKTSNALENLAGNLLGVNNQVGNLAEGLLSMVGGGPLVTGVALGITVVAGALFYFNKQARDAKKAYDDWLDSLRKNTPLSIVGAQLDTEKEKLDRLEANFARMKDYVSVQGKRMGVTPELAAQRALVAGLQAQYDAILRDMRDASQRDAAKIIGDRQRESADIIAKAMADRGRAGADTVAGKLFGGPKSPEEPLGLRLGGDFTTMIPEVQQAGTVFTDFADTLDLIVFRMGAISDATAGIAEGFAALGDVVGGGIGNVAKKVLAPFMKLEGTYFVIKGLAKLADGLFPPNPALIASGSGMVARGRQLLSMAGGGTPGGGSGSGGGSAAGGATRDVQDATRRGTVTITMREGFVSTRDPRWQEELAETIRNAAGRNIVFNMVPA